MNRHRTQKDHDFKEITERVRSWATDELYSWVKCQDSECGKEEIRIWSPRRSPCVCAPCVEKQKEENISDAVNTLAATTSPTGGGR